MPRLPHPGKSKKKKSYHHPSKHKSQTRLWICVLCTTGVVLYTLRLYQPDLKDGIYRIKRIIEVKKKDYSFTFNSTRKEIPLENGPILTNNKRPGSRKIAILANYVSKDDSAFYDVRFGPHLMNKACYADLWGYDFIFNTSWGFPEEIRGRNANADDTRLCFLDWGHWHRVPQLISLTESDRDYEWILWTDNEYVFWDLTQPLESLLQEIEMNNLHNVQVVVPDDNYGYIFSSFAVLIRNSHFGRRVLENWMDFAKGICPNGNYEGIKNCEGYHWIHADQVGLWYALGKTYSDLVEGSDNFVANCNNQTGYLDPRQGEQAWRVPLGFDVSNYFTKEGLIKSSDYSQIPHDQPILWSSYEKNTPSGIGINHGYIKDSDEDYKGVFAVHIKRQLRGKLQHSQSEYCGKPVAEGGRGCHVGTNDQGVFDISCGNTSYVAWDSNQLHGTTS